MTAKELRRQSRADKHRLKRNFARARARHTRIPLLQAIDEEQQEEEQANPGIFLPNLGAAIAAFLQSRRDNFKH